MDNARNENILNRQISGFHQYILGEPACLRFVSDDLCDLLGLPKPDLSGGGDWYLDRVHPGDRETYLAFLAEVTRTGSRRQADYRLCRGDGTVLRVRDTLTPARREDGVWEASSVLTELGEDEALRFFQETMPCAFLRYTCEQQPRITYLDRTMADLLRLPPPGEGELGDLDLYKSNIFLLIPAEERRRFARYLDRVAEAGTPLAGEMTVLRCDGTRARLFGWVAKVVNDRGEPEFQSVCMDMTQRYQAQKARETQRYLEALTEVYDKIFQFDLETDLVKCLHCEDDSSFQALKGVAMQIDDAAEKWITSAVRPEDRDRVGAFFRAFCQRGGDPAQDEPPQLAYRARSGDGQWKDYVALCIRLDASLRLYCCRRVQEPGAGEKAPAPGLDGMQALVRQFADGLAAFEVSAEGWAKPLYGSENVCEFFGYTRREWLTLMETFTPLEQFVAGSDVACEDFEALLRTGEAEFSYFDYKTEQTRRIKAICSQREGDSRSSRYVMLYTLAEGTEAPGAEEKAPARRVFLRTFGYFDVFVGDQPIPFRNKKAKELLALLTDRKGGYVTSEEAIGFLWEEEPVNPVTLARYRKVALRLKNTLEEYGVADIVSSVDGKRRLVPEKVRCDLYDYLTGREEHAQLFKGSYLTNYSWGETTLGELTNGQGTGG